jgi:hypothetical protein
MRRSWIVGLFVLGMLSPWWQGDARGADPSGGELIRLLDAADKQYAQVHDYTAVMVSRERVKDVLLDQERILLKFQRTFKVYMRWMAGPSQGREGLYVSGDGHEPPSGD